MTILRSLLLAVYFSLCLHEGKGQVTELNVPLQTFSDCNGGFMSGECPDINDRIFVHYMFGGTKNSSYGCPFVKNTSYPETCCTLDETEDCYKRLPDTFGINYRSSCIGQDSCSIIVVGTTYTAPLNCTDIRFTHYIGIAFYCFNFDSIGTLSSANKRNDGQGSLLHLWGVGDDYGTLPTGQLSCSIETDCGDSIYVISMDFRFQNFSGNCPDENTISIMDDRMTTFTCTSNNNFVIKQLYRNNRHYINLTYYGHTAGGYLWLTFISTGNLTLNCPATDPENDCPYPSTTEVTTFTTEETTITEETTTTGTTSTTETTHTEETTTYLDETTTTETTSTAETTSTTEKTITEETTTTGTTSTEETTTGTTPTEEMTTTGTTSREETTTTTGTTSAEKTTTAETATITYVTTTTNETNTMDSTSTENTSTTSDVTTTNETITTEGPSHEDSTNDQKIALIILIVVVILVVLALILIIGYRKYKKHNITKMNAEGVSPETDDSNNIINNGDKYQADGLPPIMGIYTNQDLGKTEVEEENNFETIMTSGLLPPINHMSEIIRKKRKKKMKHKNKNKHKEEFIDDNEDQQKHNNDDVGKENEWTDKIIENSENINTEHQGKNGKGNESATKFEHMKDFDNVYTADENKYGHIKICDNIADEGMGEINDGHKEISAFINIDNECKSDKTRKKKKKKRKKSKSNKVHATYDETEETPFNVEVCKIPPASNEDDEYAQSHKTEIIKEKSVGVETDSLYGESVGDTQEKTKNEKTS